MPAIGKRRLPGLIITISIVLVVIIGAVFVSRNYISPKRLASDGSPKAVTVAQWGQEKYLIYLPLYVALEEGYFSREGLDVRIKYTGNDDQTFAAVVSGDASFGIGDPVFAAISQEKGFPARVIGTLVGGVAIWGVTNEDEVDYIENPEQLEGLRIGTFPSPSTNFTLMQELISKLPDDAIKPTIIQAPIGSQLALLESGDAHIAMVLEPGASLAERNGYRVVYSSPQFNGPYAFTGVTTTEDILLEDPDTAQKFIRALELSLADCHADSSIPIRVGKKLFPNLDPIVVENAVRRMLNERTIPEHVEVTDLAWQKALATRLTVGDLKEPQATSVTIDNSFAKMAQTTSQ